MVDLLIIGYYASFNAEQFQDRDNLVIIRYCNQYYTSILPILPASRAIVGYCVQIIYNGGIRVHISFRYEQWLVWWKTRSQSGQSYIRRILLWKR
jgi:hypothetical protein